MSKYIPNADWPAFPKVVPDGDPQINGITKFEYFAAFAPMIIPDWFIHDMEPKPVLPSWLDVPETHQEDVKKWIDGLYDELPEELEWFVEKFNKAHDDRKFWDRKNDVARYFQWRQYYANYMCRLKEINEPKPMVLEPEE